jgi:hypothetical protein
MDKKSAMVKVLWTFIFTLIALFFLGLFFKNRVMFEIWNVTLLVLLDIGLWVTIKKYATIKY